MIKTDSPSLHPPPSLAHMQGNVSMDSEQKKGHVAFCPSPPPHDPASFITAAEIDRNTRRPVPLALSLDCRPTGLVCSFTQSKCSRGVRPRSSPLRKQRWHKQLWKYHHGDRASQCSPTPKGARTTDQQCNEKQQLTFTLL